MKYRFITILHRMKLEGDKNKGIEIAPGVRLSNGKSVLYQTIHTELMLATLGVHSITEFKDVVYLYADGEFSESTKEDVDEFGVKQTFVFLRSVQSFLYNLWEVRDHNIYIRDGFLLVYDKNFEDGFTYKASLSEVFTDAKGELDEVTIIPDQEIKMAKKDYIFDINDRDDETFGGRNPSSDHFFKGKGSTRLQRARYFVVGARNSSILPMKIISYCTALECLFTIGKTEINHKIAERVALLLGTSKETKQNLFKIIKDAYNYRSALVHGQYLKGTNEDLLTISVSLDEILRKLLTGNIDIFSMDDKTMENYYLDLLFASEKEK